jgi:hypothetical protein
VLAGPAALTVYNSNSEVSVAGSRKEGFYSFLSLEYA